MNENFFNQFGLREIKIVKENFTTMAERENAHLAKDQILAEANSRINELEGYLSAEANKLTESSTRIGEIKAQIGDYERRIIQLERLFKSFFH